MPSKPRVERNASARGGKPAQERQLRPQGRKTLQRLLEAGLTVFEKQGFHAARVDDIVKTAKTSHGTFYLYFSNKEDLFRALALDAMKHMELLGTQLGPVTLDAAGRAALRAWVSEYVDVYNSHGTIIRAMTNWEYPAPDLGHVARDALVGLSSALGNRIREARDLDDSALIEGVACLSMLERFNYFQQSHQVQFAREAVIETLTRAVFEGFFTPSASLTATMPVEPRRSRLRRGAGASASA